MMFKFFFQPYPFPDSVIYSRMGLLDFLLCKKWPPLAFHSRFWKTKKQNQSISFKNVFLINLKTWQFSWFFCIHRVWYIELLNFLSVTAVYLMHLLRYSEGLFVNNEKFFQRISYILHSFWADFRFKEPNRRIWKVTSVSRQISRAVECVLSTNVKYLNLDHLWISWLWLFGFRLCCFHWFWMSVNDQQTQPKAYSITDGYLKCLSTSENVSHNLLVPLSCFPLCMHTTTWTGAEVSFGTQKL